MHDEGLTKEIAAERATMTRDQVKPEDLERACSQAGKPGHCTVSAGMGLGWEVETVNGVKILDHDGSDWGVRTFAMFVPSQGIGVVVLTNGENGKEVIRKVVEALYPEHAIHSYDVSSDTKVHCTTGHSPLRLSTMVQAAIRKPSSNELRGAQQ
jgi:CubicO group peptidase (beta-lactamase class C family)